METSIPEKVWNRAFEKASEAILAQKALDEKARMKQEKILQGVEARQPKDRFIEAVAHANAVIKGKGKGKSKGKGGAPVVDSVKAFLKHSGAQAEQ